jgi:uncharacterized Zn finger protein
MLSAQSLCPSRFCSAYNPVQELVRENQAQLVKEPALSGAIRCTSCGCVWVRDERGTGHPIGTLRETGARYEWKSLYAR